MAIKAVIFDYGMVLTAEPDAAAYAEMLLITGLTREQFEPLYWADRHAYDEGKLTGVAFWQKLIHDAGLALDARAVTELNRADARYWTTENTRMVRWQAELKLAGIKTAILSNMGDNVLESLLAAFPWVQNFDWCTWSFQLGMAKPDPRIYEYTLAGLGAKAEETLFIDDRGVNVEAARKLGMNALRFTTVENLAHELHASGFSQSIPSPQ